MPLEPQIQKTEGPLEYEFDNPEAESVTYTVQFGVLDSEGKTIKTKTVTFTLNSLNSTKTLVATAYGGQGIGCVKLSPPVVKPLA